MLDFIKSEFKSSGILWVIILNQIMIIASLTKCKIIMTNTWIFVVSAFVYIIMYLIFQGIYTIKPNLIKKIWEKYDSSPKELVRVAIVFFVGWAATTFKLGIIYMNIFWAFILVYKYYIAVKIPKN